MSILRRVINEMVRERRLTRIPPEIELHGIVNGRDVSFIVRYDYTPAQRDTWVPGVGGTPAHDAEVEITEVNFGKGWMTPDRYPHIDFSQYEDQLLNQIYEYEAD